MSTTLNKTLPPLWQVPIIFVGQNFILLFFPISIPCWPKFSPYAELICGELGVFRAETSTAKFFLRNSE